MNENTAHQFESLDQILGILSNYNQNDVYLNRQAADAFVDFLDNQYSLCLEQQYYSIDIQLITIGFGKDSNRITEVFNKAVSNWRTHPFLCSRADYLDRLNCMRNNYSSLDLVLAAHKGNYNWYKQQNNLDYVWIPTQAEVLNLIVNSQRFLSSQEFSIVRWCLDFFQGSLLPELKDWLTSVVNKAPTTIGNIALLARIEKRG